MWECPTCGRRFKNTNQSHSCQLFSLEHHLWNKPAKVVALYQMLAAFAEEIGEVDIEPMKSTILFRRETAFWSVAIHRTFVRVLFQLHRLLPDRSEWHVTQVSPGRYVYEVKLTDPDQIDDEMRRLLLEAASLTGADPLS
ncbi:MAG: DUF5655 domain-containing protein [Rhodothermales bacterium]|nr:DUF5655 domain-containing protein [Rhodothermales bacterium]